VLLGASVLCAALWALASALEPDPRGYGTHEQLGFRPCYPLAHWNVPCPACGVTTALGLFVRGRLLESLRAQPLGAVLAVALVAFTAWSWSAHRRGRDLALELPRLPWRRFGKALALLAALAWLYKLFSVRAA
jgi:hypothetical protein